MLATQVQLVRGGVAEEIAALGGRGIWKCYQCGTCTAVCPLSREQTIRSRRLIKYIQLGLEGKILSDTTPWLCYYCGECNDSCPKGADPGEIMMAARRYLTTKYDWTGISRRIYHSKAAEFVGALALFAIAMIMVYLFHGPIVTDRVDLNAFAPLHVVEAGDIVILVVLSAILITNIYRMYRFVMSGASRPPLGTCVAEFVKIVPKHFLTQIRMKHCGSSREFRNWVMHLLIVYGYATIFVLVVVFLRVFQTNVFYPIYHPARLFGYLATVALFVGIGYAAYGRIKKSQPARKYSHPTDWLFLTLLFLTVLTGILMSIFKYMYMPLETYYTYAIHLGVATALLVLEVPFAKWSHLAYRPFALYFERLRELGVGGGLR